MGVDRTSTPDAQLLREASPVTMDTKVDTTPGIKQLRDAIPDHCFQPSNTRSFAYIVRDVALSLTLAFLAFRFIALVPDTPTRWLLWTLYGAAQGMIFCGIWILAHECGHQALFTSRLRNDSLGFILHSMLLVPYFSWKYSHGLHHRYTNHMEKDTAFVPFRKAEIDEGTQMKQTEEKHSKSSWFSSLHVAEDAPAVNLALLVAHQLFGFPAYLLLNVSAGPKSTMQKDRASSARQSHFDPGADIFTKQQHPFVLLSDLGLAVMLGALYLLGAKIGFANVALLYGAPYLWVNNWIVAITYLHHNFPGSQHFEAERWNFRDGQLSTIDRDFGFIGKHVFHGIIDHHVIHHLFTKIPFYHAEEATDAITGILGEKYHRVETSFWKDLWKTFTALKVVEASKHDVGVLVWS